MRNKDINSGVGGSGFSGFHGVSGSSGFSGFHGVSGSSGFHGPFIKSEYKEEKIQAKEHPFLHSHENVIPHKNEEHVLVDKKDWETALEIYESLIKNVTPIEQQNDPYATAIVVVSEYRSTHFITTIDDFVRYCNERLNSKKD